MNRLKHLLLLSIISSSLTIGTFSVFKEIKIDPSLHVKAMPADYDALESEPLFSSQTHFNHLNRGDVLDSYRGDGLTIAIIDTGVNTSHVDFISGTKTNILTTSAYFKETGTVYSNIEVKTVSAHGLSIINDTNGHGTNVAGTIGALVNGVGTAGLSPNVNLLILKTNFDLNEINKAIRYAADNGAAIINMSIQAYANTFTSPYTKETITGYIGNDTHFQSAINYAYNKGVTLVAAAGNHATTIKSYPASNANVISVGALANNSSTSIAAYSNLGTSIDIVAPGTVYVPDTGSSTSYRSTNGTSFSAPLVASAIALYKQKHPNATPLEIQNKLEETAYDLGVAGKDTTFGHGRMDLTELMAGEEEVVIPVTGVSISPKTLNLNIGETATLTATITPSDATNQEMLFISNDDDIATVDEVSGLVTATGIGTTEIGVLTDDGMFEDSATVNVTSIYTPTFSLNINGVKQSYTFKEPLNFDNLTGQYLSITGQTTELSVSDLTFVSGNTNTLGVSAIVFSYLGYLDEFDISVTNIGSEQGDKDASPKSISIKGNNSDPSLTGSAANYTNITFGGKNFSGNSLRNMSPALYIASGGFIYNKDPLDYITSITMNYTTGSSPSAIQTFYFSENVISSTSGLSSTKTISSSTPGTSSTVNAPEGMSFFRINISNKNIQNEIFVNYKGGGVLRFTDLEQAAVYYDFFMDVTHEECLVRDVNLATWNMLKGEYNPMVDEAKTLLTSEDYEDLVQRYLMILNEYDYEDFMQLSKAGLFSRNNAFLLERKDEIIIIAVLLSSTIFSAFAFTLLRRKKDRNQ